MAPALDALGWVGARARWVLALGCVAALFLPALASFMRPALPVLVAVVLALSMARIDLAAVALRALRPRRLAATLGVAALLMVATPAGLWAASAGLGSPDLAAALVYLGVSPPIASAAGLSFILGLDAAFALEITVLATLLAPLIGPVVAALLLGAAAPVAPLALSVQLAAMIAGGAALALALRRLLGPAAIARRGAAFDGVVALAMLVFVIPLFDGVGATILAWPWFSLGVLALVFLANWGLQIGFALAGRPLAARAAADALGLCAGNRNVAIYLAALPASPALGLFVALYQFPMYLTPLALGRFYRRRAQAT